MVPFPLIYDDGFDLQFGQHVFPSSKYRLIRERLIANGVASPESFLKPQPATRDELLTVHTENWIDRLANGRLDYHDILRLEIPYSRPMVNAFWLAAGGSIAAVRAAVAQGAGFNVGGGFHHAFAGHGEGFCAVNDIAVAIRVAQRDGLVRRAMVVDCDVHHGNGTAAIFTQDDSVFTLSIHQLNNYPYVKPASDVDIDLDDATGDAEYLSRLSDGYGSALETFHPELIVYVAGADPYYEDQLGGLDLTKSGLHLRDRLVFDRAIERKIPVAAVLAGGYARDIADTVEIHANTVEALEQSLRLKLT
jgi:acetoin utilization deacetylase AcuC-like enzyme